MDVTVRVATADEQPIFANLIQLYFHDFSDLRGLDGGDVGDDGRFAPYRYLNLYWIEPSRHPFLIRVDGKLAGFVLVREGSALTGDPGVRDIAEFFVLRKYRRHGIGTRAAVCVFDRFPGAWEVRQIAANAGGRAFWRRTISDYAGGRFTEDTWGDNEPPNTVQRFDTRDRAVPPQSATKGGS